MTSTEASVDAALIQTQRFPLNVYTFIAQEHFGSTMLHFGFFESGRESLLEAQQRASALLLAALPPPPARIVEVGIGFGTTMCRLLAAGYDVVGITPEPVQREFVLSYVAGARVTLGSFDDVATQLAPADVVLLQESAQYIDQDRLWEGCAGLLPVGGQVLIADEFRAASGTVERGSLHRLDAFVAAARRRGFEIRRERDLGRQAAPTLRRIREGIIALRSRIENELGEAPLRVDALLAANDALERDYVNGDVTYAVLEFDRAR